MPKDKCMFCYIARMGVDWRNHMKYSTVRTFASYHERMLYYFPNRCWRLFGPQGFHLGRVNRAWSVLEASTVLYSTVQHCTVLYSTVEAPRSKKKRGTKAIRSAIHCRSRFQNFWVRMLVGFRMDLGRFWGWFWKLGGRFFKDFGSFTETTGNNTTPQEN